MYIIYLATKEQEIHGQITQLITQAKHKVWKMVLPNGNDKNASNEIAQLIKEIKKADAVVVEATNPNFEMGRFITHALQQYKPVLMLQEEAQRSPLLLGETRLVTQTTYNKDQSQLSNTLSSFFKIVAKQRLLYRFNFMMSKEMNSFLKDKALEHGISQADYIRTLIMEVMEDAS